MFTSIKIFCVTFLVTVSASTVYGQKTTRLPISEQKGITLQRNITERDGAVDTVFLMMGQNAKYTHVVNTIILKHGSPEDINDLLTACMKFLPEAEDTTLEYEGNTLMSMGKGRIMLFGSGRDKMGYIILNKALITKLQTDLKPHIK